MLYLFIYLWLYLYPMCHEFKIWSQVLMKEEILKSINGVCWLLLNTFHATHELHVCCLKINIFFSCILDLFGVLQAEWFKPVVLYADLRQWKLEPVAVSNETNIFFHELNAAWKELVL